MEEKEKVKEEEKTEAPEKPKSKKGLIVLAVVIAIVGLLVAGWKYVTRAQTNTILTVDSGQTQVNGKDAKSGQVLKDSDTVKTLPASGATVTFPEGTEIRLDENTEIKINSQGENISILQTVGRTWSRVVNLLGIVDYEVKSTGLTASVRGTAFSTEVVGDTTNLDVDEGSVDAAGETDQAIIEAGRGVDGQLGRRLSRRAVRRELLESDWFRKNRERDRVLLDRIRKRASSPLQIIKTAREVSPDDIAKLRSLATRFGSGGAMITEAQANQLESLDLSSPSGMARALAIIDPQNFSDTRHWTRVISTLLPLIERFGVEKVLEQR